MKLELTKEDINIIAGALQEMPHKFVHEVINKIAAQVQNQEGNKRESGDQT